MSSSDVRLRLLVSGEAEVRQALGSAGKDLDGLKNKADSVGTTAKGIVSGLVQLAGAIGVAFAVKEFLQAADNMSLLSARLKVAAGTSAEFAQAQAEEYRIAQANNVGLQETARLYTKLSDPVKRFGGTARETGAIVDSFATSLRVGGASTQEAAAATLQFAQAMGSGKLQGDEFRSIAEASPRFMKALAEGMGAPIEQLKQMGADGKLTADIVGNALIKSLGKLKSEAASLPDTVGGALTRLKNDALVAVADIDKSSGLTLGLASLVELVRTDLLPTIRDELAGAFKSVGEFISENREQIAEALEVAKRLVSDAWEIAKAFGQVVAAVTALAYQSGLVKAALETLRLLIAGMVDGVDILGAALAWAGAQLLTVAGMFSDTAKSMAADAEAYANGVFRRFADGGSAVAGLGREMAKSALDAKRIKDALDGTAVSAADSARELRGMTEKADAASGGFRRLKSGAAGATEEQLKMAASVRKLIGDLQSKIAAEEIETAQQAKLTEAQKLALGIMEKLRDGTIRGTTAEHAQIAALLEGLLAQEKRTAAEKEAALFREAATRAVGEQTLAELKEADAIGAQISKQREHNDTIGKTTEQLAALEAQKLADALATAEQNLQDGIRAGVNAETLAAITLQVEGLRELKKLKDEGVITQATVDQAKAAAEAWKQTSDAIGQGLTDSLFRAFESGKGFFDTLWNGIVNTFKTTVLQPTIRAIMAPVTGSIGSLIGGGAQAGTEGSALGGGGILSSLGSAGSLLGSLGTLGSFGLTGAMSAFTGTGLGTLLGASGSLISGGSIAGGLGLGLGAIAPYALAAVAAGALLKKAFGRGPKQTTDSGVTGTATGGDIDAQTYSSWLKKGGWLRSDKKGTDFGALGDDQAAALKAASSAVYGQTQAWASALKLPAKALADVSYAFKIQLGADEKANAAAIDAAFAGYQGALANRFKIALEPFQRAGETLAETLGRLAELQTFSDAINSFGGVFSRVAQLGITAKEELIGFAGGMQSLIAKTQSFVESYYSESERYGLAARQVQGQLKAAGITADVSSLADFRAIVESTSLNTTAGRQQLSDLLNIAQAFAPIGKYLEETGGTLSGLAAGAPQSAMLESLLSQADTGKQTVDGLQAVSVGVKDAGNQVANAVAALQESTEAGLAAVIAATAANTRLLQSWDGGGYMLSTGP